MYLQPRLAVSCFSRILSADLSIRETRHVMKDLAPYMWLVLDGAVKKLMRLFACVVSVVCLCLQVYLYDHSVSISK